MTPAPAARTGTDQAKGPTPESTPTRAAGPGLTLRPGMAELGRGVYITGMARRRSNRSMLPRTSDRGDASHRGEHLDGVRDPAMPTYAEAPRAIIRDMERWLDVGERRRDAARVRDWLDREYRLGSSSASTARADRPARRRAR